LKDEEKNSLIITPINAVEKIGLHKTIFSSNAFKIVADFAFQDY
jgi:hypothetical protein